MENNKKITHNENDIKSVMDQVREEASGLLCCIRDNEPPCKFWFYIMDGILDKLEDRLLKPF